MLFYGSTILLTPTRSELRLNNTRSAGEDGSDFMPRRTTTAIRTGHGSFNSLEAPCFMATTGRHYPDTSRRRQGKSGHQAPATTICSPCKRVVQLDAQPSRKQRRKGAA